MHKNSTKIKKIVIGEWITFEEKCTMRNIPSGYEVMIMC